MKTDSTANMTHRPLDDYIEAVREDEPTAIQSDQAQRRLMARIDGRRPSNRAPVRPWRWAIAAALVLFMVPVLVMMPGSNGSVAFAQVQAYFTDFQTMKAQMTTRMNGNTVLTMDIIVDDQDRMRLDSGREFSFIIDPNEQLMLQLFHRQARATRVALGHGGTAEPPLDWLEQIRKYQGQSRLIDESRTIDGVEVFGFRLTDQAVDMTLWATEQNRPVLLEINTGTEAAAATTQVTFSFNQPVSAERFSLEVPTGYTVTTQVDED